MPLAEKYIDQARGILEEIAGRRGSPIPYVELTHRLGIATRAAGGVLIPISNESYKSRRVLLSVLVVQKASGIPCKRFFEQAQELGAMRNDDLPQRFFRAELQRVYDAYGAPPN
jgi:hypothetical protein